MLSDFNQAAESVTIRGMKLDEVMRELERLGNEQTRKTLMRHGVPEPLFGVRIGDLKPLRKKLKGHHALALELYATGNSDAMYLAGLIADETAVTRTELNRWVREANCPLHANTTVAALAAESPHALVLARKWMESPKELVAAAGWSTLTHHLSLVGDELSEPEWTGSLVGRVVDEIHNERNEVKAAMNGFLIALGCFCPSFTETVRKAAGRMGPVEVDQGDTACRTPDIAADLDKVEKLGRLGKTKKAARC